MISAEASKYTALELGGTTSGKKVTSVLKLQAAVVPTTINVSMLAERALIACKKPL